MLTHPKEEQQRDDSQRPQTLPQSKLRGTGNLIILVAQGGAAPKETCDPHDYADEPVASTQAPGGQRRSR